MIHSTFSLRALFLPLGVIFLLGCASIPAKKLDVNEAIILFEPAALRDIMEPQGMAPMDAFEKNLFIGRILFSGGIIQDPVRGNIWRAKYVELSDETGCHRKISQIVQNSILEVLRKKKYSPAQEPLPQKIEGTPLTVDTRLSEGDPGVRRTDNINIPYVYYTISPGPDLGAVLPSPKSGLVLLPIIECAYSHSGGWFNERGSGTTAGIRVILQIIGFDAQSGEIHYRFRQDYKNVPSGFSSILSDREIDDLFANQFAAQFKKEFAKTIK